MKLKPWGLNNIYTCNCKCFVLWFNKQQKNAKVGGWAIVSLSSTENLVYIENYAGHGTNKAAVEAMVRYAANELGEFGIRVNAVFVSNWYWCIKSILNYEEVKAKTAEYY